MNTKYYSKKSDIKKHKKKFEEIYKYITEDTRKKDYNSFYWDRYLVMKKSMLTKIKAIKDIDTYLEAWNEDYIKALSLDTEIDEFMDNPPDSYVMDQGEYDAYDIEDGDIEQNIKYYIFSNESLKETRFELYRELKEYINDIKDYHIFTVPDELIDEIKAFKKNTGKYEDMNDIINEYLQISDSLNNEYEKNRSNQLTMSDVKRLCNELYNIYLSYDLSNYSNNGQKKLLGIYHDYKNKLMYIAERYNVSNEYAELAKENIIDELNGVPNKKAELKKFKNNSINSLKRFLKNKKYNQSKVKKLVKKAVAEIKKQDSLSKAKKVYKKYIKAIRKLRVNYPPLRN